MHILDVGIRDMFESELATGLVVADIFVRVAGRSRLDDFVRELVWVVRTDDVVESVMHGERILPDRKFDLISTSRSIEMNENEMIAWIDGASYEDLFRKNRFAPIGDPFFVNDVVFEHFSKAIRRLRPSSEEYTRISKKIGWE